MSSNPTKPKGLSLYANLLGPSDPSTPGTISRAPVVFKQPDGDEQQQEEAATQKQQISAATLRFQPTKRPQIASQKAKPTVPKSFNTQAPTTAPQVPEEQPTATRQILKPTLADWTNEGDNDEWGFGEKRQRGGRKKRKKNKEELSVTQNWDDIYDPSRPNNYEEYRHSDEKFREIRDWKDKLYAHRMTQRQSSFSDSEDDENRRPLNQFAPPSFHRPSEERKSSSPPAPPPPAPAPAFVPDDPTGEDAYARRLRLSGQGHIAVQGNFSSGITQSRELPTNSVAANPASGQISRAPVRYNLPPAPEDIPKTEAELENALKEDAEDQNEPAEEAPRSLRPGQKGFAERLMSKYGWQKGSGLGASNSGIINPLQVKVEKQKKKPDSEGGGFVGPGGRGKIIGGKKKGGEDHGKFGPMSEVVMLRNMLDGMDIKHELSEGNIRQEIGEECGEKYGRVERVFIDPSAPSNAPVYIKFTSQLSALRAVNALEGRIFNGNTIIARFFDTDDFEEGRLA